MLNKSFNFFLLIFIFLIFTACEDKFKKGYSQGYRDGKSSGYSSGYNSGYDDGKEIGYKNGFSKGEIQGFSDGYHQGEINGSVKGYKEGLSRGENELIVDSFIPTFAGTILILISLITLFFFIKYFHKPIEEKIKSLLYLLSNIYKKYLLKEKLYIQEQHQQEIIDFKTDILMFKFSKQVQESKLYYEIHTELFEILNLVKIFMQEKQFNIYSKIKNDYEFNINSILTNSVLTNKEKDSLIEELYNLIMNEYLLDIEENKKGIERIDIGDFKEEYLEFQKELKNENLNKEPNKIFFNNEDEKVKDKDFDFSDIQNIEVKKIEHNFEILIISIVAIITVSLILYKEGIVLSLIKSFFY